jgi:hypothetical protein
MNCAVHTETPAAAYCRACGKALCDNCKRDVMGAIFCEPCIAVRLQGNPPITPVVTPTVPGTPSPGVAMLLGFIPGVGAMYNGQFLKGLIHVMIFVVLIIAASHNGGFGVFFGLMVPFFIFYMAFDAYKTAEARRLGLPAPDLLGLDRLFGLQDPSPVTPPGITAPIASVSNAGPVADATHAHHEPVPTAAVVLIILGVVFLLGNLTALPLHRLWPVTLIAIGLWLAYKRLATGPREVR